MRNIGAVSIVTAAALGLAACSSSAASPRSNAGATTPTSTNATTTTTAPGRLEHWTNSGPPLKIGAPFCDGGHCLYPFTETGAFHGDLEGKHVSSGVAAVDATGKKYAVSRTTVFIGTVKGCGSGTMVFLEGETASSTGGTGHGTIAPGFGTGALRSARGDGAGVGVAGSGGITSKFTGHITC